MGAALAAAAGFMAVPVAQAGLDDTVTNLDPSAALIMPFDVTANHASFQLVSRIGGDTSDPIATHWSFWSKDCNHLADVFICLTPRDTVVVDPTNLQSEIQSGVVNTKTGPVVNLTGEKGFITVTAFESDLSGFSGFSCNVADPEAVITDPGSLVGSWVIANTSTSSGFGTDAIGVRDGQTLPDPSVFDVGTGIFILIGVTFPGGNGAFFESEIGPIPALLPGGAAACCDADVFDNLENFVSLPDVCFTCTGFAPIADSVAIDEDDVSLIPPTTAVDSSGFLRLNNCLVGGSEGPNPIADGVGADGNPAFIFAFHGMAVGPFGTVVSGKYTLL
jgi:hypothetical protein